MTSLFNSLISAVKNSNGGMLVARRLERLWVERDRVYYPRPRATIDTLPDNVLLELFEFYLGKDNPDELDRDHNYDGWQTLVHVCRRWRCIVFASPRRLGLKLYCTQNRSANSKMLEIWPELPIVIFARLWPILYLPFKEDVTSVNGALRHHNRVCKIHYENLQHQDLLLEEFAAIDEPFPALTSLRFVCFSGDVPALPDSFLGGSAPRLRSLFLDGIPYPSVGTLLSSTTNLVRLTLWRIPHSGYISPETIVPCLSTLVRLESLSLGLQHPRSGDNRASRHPPSLTRVVLPNLTFLVFRGDIEYLEDILSQIETPVLKSSTFNFFNQLVFDTPLLGHFIGRTKTFKKNHRAQVKFSSNAVEVALSGREEMTNKNREALRLEITCTPLDWQLSAVAQVLSSFLSTPPALENLEITITHKNWHVEIEAIQWQEFLHPFTFVKKMTLMNKDSVQLVAYALQKLAEEGATGVLPALQNIFLETGDRQPSGPVKAAIEQFIATRQPYGHPIMVQRH